MFFSCLKKMFLVGLATVVRLCFTSDTVLLIDWLYCIDLFSCIAASVFNKLTYFAYLSQSTAQWKDWTDWWGFLRSAGHKICTRRLRSSSRHVYSWLSTRVYRPLFIVVVVFMTCLEEGESFFYNFSLLIYHALFCEFVPEVNKAINIVVVNIEKCV